MSERDPSYITPEQALAELPESVNLHFFFALHKYKEDFALLPDLMRQCDIYVPETPCWDEAQMALYNRIAQGSKTDYQVESQRLGQFTSHEASIFELRLLYGSHKKVALGGFRSDDPRFTQLKLMARQLDGQRFTSSEEFLEAHRQYGEIQRLREEEILYDLAPNLGGLISNSKKLADKSEVNVLINLGAAHTSVHKRAASALNTPDRRRVTRSFFEKPVLFPLSMIVPRRHIFGLPIDIASAQEDVRRMEQSRLSDES